MKSDHRHDLKRNELADWLTHLPEWAKKYQYWLIGSAAAVLIVAGFFVWKVYFRDPAIVQSQVELTTLMADITQKKGMIIQGQSQGLDNASVLNTSAQGLLNFAAQQKGSIAAMAYIQAGDALRAEMLYTIANVAPADMKDQMDQAKSAYESAMLEAPDIPSLQARAKYGTGLCAEHLEDFATAREVYQEVATSKEYKGTVAAAAAANRLEIMGDLSTKVTFPPKPIEMQVQPSDPNDPTDIPGMPPIESLLEDVNDAAPEMNLPDTNAVSSAVKQDIAEAATEADVNEVEDAVIKAVTEVAEKIVAPNKPAPSAADANEQ